VREDDSDDGLTTDDENELVEAEVARPRWKAFEGSVAEMIARLGDGATVERDTVLPGAASGVHRQVDVLVSGTIGGSRLKIAVECKLYKRRLGIGKVDEFVGKLLDLKVQHGVLYCVSGFTDGAIKRAEDSNHPSIELKVVPEHGRVEINWSEVLGRFAGLKDCPNENCYTGEIRWQEWPQDDGTAIKAGSCYLCGTWAVRCVCGNETGFFLDETTCHGCGQEYSLVSSHKGEGYIGIVADD
jgi:hypothetical protein